MSTTSCRRRPSPVPLLLIPMAAAALAADTGAQVGIVVRDQTRIASQSGGFSGTLDPVDRFGEGLAGLGDVDGDGVPDLAVGAPSDDGPGINRGAIHLLLLNTDGTVKAEQEIGDGTGGFPFTLDDGACFGGSLAALGDLDGDGTPDLAAGARDEDDLGESRGAVFVLFLQPDGSVKSATRISEGLGGFADTLDDYDEFGQSVAAIGDLDGDGRTDLVVGSIGDDDGAANAGAVRVLFLDMDGTVKAEQKIAPGVGGFVGPLDPGDSFGESVAGIGDLDGDGLGDIVVGACGDDDAGTSSGAIWILFPDADGTLHGEAKISGTTGGFTGSLGSNDAFGRSVAAMGDLDGDGSPDVAVGASGDDDGGSRRGAVWVLFLSQDGTTHLVKKISDTEGYFTGTLADDDGFGWDVSLVGDLDQDGQPDLAVGAPQDDEGGFDEGAVWLLFLQTGPEFDIGPAAGAGGIDTRAGLAKRNGSGVNPDIFDATLPPFLGQTWVATVDTSSIGGSGLSILAAFGAPASGVFSSYGELLVDPTGGLLASGTALAFGGLATHSLPVPSTGGLAGVPVYVQCLVTIGPTTVLTNALDLVLGY